MGCDAGTVCFYTIDMTDMVNDVAFVGSVIVGKGNLIAGLWQCQKGKQILRIVWVYCDGQERLVGRGQDGFDIHEEDILLSYSVLELHPLWGVAS